MNFARELFEDLKSKPAMLIAAIALLVALVAVPILLSKSAEEPTARAPSPSIEEPTPDTETNIANVAQETPDRTAFPQQEGKSVRVFARKNPFATSSSAGGAGVASPTGATGATGATGTTDGDTTGTTGGDTTGGTGGDTTGGTGSAVSYFTWVAKVRFGKASKKLQKKTLEGLRSLPSSKNPILVFLGVSSNGKNAVFLLSSSATTTGDGRCAPSDDECSFIYMKKKDSQTIEAISSDGDITTYELKLDDIDAKKISDPTAASAAKKRRLSKKLSKLDSKKLRRVERGRQKRKAKRVAKRKQNHMISVLDKIGF